MALVEFLVDIGGCLIISFQRSWQHPISAVVLFDN